MMENDRPKKVLIVEDEPEMVRGLRDNLEFEGYEVLVGRDGVEGLAAMAHNPDLLLLDVMLPRQSGLDVCRELRKNGVDIPIIMLTAKSQEVDKVVGLEIGADDYVTKPFSIKELLARVRAHLRRTSGRSDRVRSYKFGEIEIDFDRFTAFRNSARLELSPREFALLEFLIRNRGRTVTREQLLDEVWGCNSFLATRTVDNHVSKLRQKIGDLSSKSKFILTVHGIGYRFLG